MALQVSFGHVGGSSRGRRTILIATYFLLPFVLLVLLVPIDWFPLFAARNTGGARLTKQNPTQASI